MNASLSCMVSCLLSGLESEGDDFFNQTTSLLENINNGVDDKTFYGAVWTTLLLKKEERRSVCKYILYLFSHKNYQEGPAAIQSGLIVSSITAALQDKNPLVVRDALDMIISYIYSDILAFNEQERIEIISSMLYALLQKEVSLTRRIATILTKEEIKTESITLAVEYLQKKIALDKVFKVLIHVHDIPDRGGPVCTQLSTPLILKVYRVSKKEKNEQIMKATNYFLEKCGIEIVWSGIISAMEKSANNIEAIDAIIFSLTELNVWHGTNTYAEAASLILIITELLDFSLDQDIDFELIERLIDALNIVLYKNSLVEDKPEYIDGSLVTRVIESRTEISTDTISTDKHLKMVRDKSASFYASFLVKIIQLVGGDNTPSRIDSRLPELFSLLFNYLLTEDTKYSKTHTLWEELCLKTINSDSNKKLLILSTVFSPWFSSTEFNITDQDILVERLFEAFDKHLVSIAKLLEWIYCNKKPFDTKILSLLANKDEKRQRKSIETLILFLSLTERLPLFSLTYPLSILIEKTEDNDRFLETECRRIISQGTSSHIFFYNSIISFLLIPKVETIKNTINISDNDICVVEEYGESPDDDRLGYGLLLLQRFIENIEGPFLLETIKCKDMIFFLNNQNFLENNCENTTYGEVFINIACKYFGCKGEKTKRIFATSYKILLLFIERWPNLFTDNFEIVNIIKKMIDKFLCTNEDLFYTTDILSKLFRISSRLTTVEMSKLKDGIMRQTSSDSDISCWGIVLESLINHPDHFTQKAGIILTADAIKFSGQNTSERTICFFEIIIPIIQNRTKGSIESDINLEEELIKNVGILFYNIKHSGAEYIQTVSNRISLHSERLILESLAYLFIQHPNSTLIIISKIGALKGIESFLLERMNFRILRKEPLNNEVFILLWMYYNERIQSRKDLDMSLCKLLLDKSVEQRPETIYLLLFIIKKTNDVEIIDRTLLALEQYSTISYKSSSDIRSEDFTFLFSLVNRKVPPVFTQTKISQKLYFFKYAVLDIVKDLPESRRKPIIYQNIVMNTISPLTKTNGVIGDLALSTFKELAMTKECPKTWKKEFWELLNDSTFFYELTKKRLKDVISLMALLTPYEKIEELLEKHQPSALFNESSKQKRLKLRRISLFVLSSSPDTLSQYFPMIQVKIVESLNQKSSTLTEEIFLLLRAAFLKLDGFSLQKLEPVVLCALIELFISFKKTKEEIPLILMASKLIASFFAHPSINTEEYKHSFLVSNDGDESIFKNILDQYQGVKSYGISESKEIVKRLFETKKISSADELRPFIIATTTLSSEYFIFSPLMTEDELQEFIEEDIIPID
eukprot:GHVP01035311.1.p1 GENE.GHVP01035311.1~~GHVP01035311.1.p1  ORF type:complete len:1455 (-),score=261.09 GHVP01035311.1:2310-6281(-)